MQPSEIITVAADLSSLSQSASVSVVSSSQTQVIGSAILTGPKGDTGAAGPNTITGLITAGSNVTITGSGTSGSPYSIASSGGSGSAGFAQQSTQTSSFTAASGNYYPVNASSGNVTVTLPTSMTGQRVRIKKLDANAATGASSGIVYMSGTINGASGASIPLRKINQGKELIADASGGWSVTLGDLDITSLYATTAEPGTVQLAGDLGGTPQSPTVPGLAAKAPLASPAFTGSPTAPTATSTDNSTTIATTQYVTTAILNAASTYDDVKDYASLSNFPGTGQVDVLYMANDTNYVYRWGGSNYIQVGGGNPNDATTTSKGVVQLAGDLGGTATAPTTPTALHITGNESAAGVKSFTTQVTTTASGASNVDSVFKATVDTSTANQPAILAKNNTNFAHQSNIIKAQMLNGSDTGNVVRIENSGTGKNISSTNGSTETFSVDKTGLITIGGVDHPQLDLIDVAVTSAPATLVAGKNSGVTVAGTYTAPAVAASVSVPPQRFAITNRFTGSVTLSVPNPAGTTLNLNVLPGEVITFRQVTTSGYINESGNKPLAQLDARYVSIGGVTAGTNVTVTGGGTMASPYVINATSSGSNSTTNNFNNDQIDQAGGGTSTYSALSGAINGTNAVFTVSNGSYPSGKLKVFLNGQLQTLGSTGDYTETSPAAGTFTFASAPPSGSIVNAVYPIATASSSAINQTLFTATSSKTIPGTTTEQSALPTSGIGSLTLPANSMTVGRTYYLKTFGTYQTPATPGGVTVKIKVGSVTVATATVASSILAGSSNYNELYGDACITVRSTGATGTVTCSGFLSFQIATGTTTVPFSSSADNTSYTSPTKTIDTTITNLVDVTEVWTTSTAGQGTAIDQCVLERKN